MWDGCGGEISREPFNKGGR
jgi:hypothetical protein